MSLFAAGVVLFLLLVASYSGRRLWVSLASTVMSMVALAGLLFVAIAKEPEAIRSGLIWTAGKVQLVVDQPTADTIAKVIEQLPAPAPAAHNPPAAQETTPPAIAEAAPQAPNASPAPCADTQAGCGTPEGGATGATGPQPSPPAQASIQAATTPSLPAPAPAPAAPPAPAPMVSATPGSPVVWFLDEQAQPGNASPGLVIGGMNASASPFEDVRAVLKPDGSHDELPLVLDVGGQKSDAVPAGARFSLALQGIKYAQTGGAILSFRYRQAGQVRTSILYLTPAMIARFANRG